MAKPTKKIGSIAVQASALSRFMPQEENTPPATTPAPSAQAGKKKAADGLKGYTFRLKPEALAQLSHTAIDKNMTVKDILTEAVNDWFIKNRLPPVA